MIGPAYMPNADDEIEQVEDIHKSVMLDEAIEYMHLPEGGIVVDGTLGLGGHARAFLQAVGPTGKLIGMDRDADSIQLAQKQLTDFCGQCHFVHANSVEIARVLDEQKISQVDGIFLDLGISSFQLDNPTRGFSLKSNGPLDMRMNQYSKISAFDLVNSLSEHELSVILRDYGQERWHQRIAHNLVLERAKNPIETTRELRHIVMRSMPHRRKWQKAHPATRTFQAIRIAVNRELDTLQEIVNTAVKYLKPGGRIGIISFHSLEDRIVKVAFKSMAKEGQLKLIVKKPLRPIEDEVRKNPRARSACFRIAERI